MKYLHLILLTVLFLFSDLAGAKAQATASLPVATAIPSLHLAVNCTKTTHLVFPYKIKSVDRGSRDLLVQKANGADNVLQLKAAREHFEETNLSVITADGKFYSFDVQYAALPLTLTLRFSKDSSTTNDQYCILPENTNDAMMEGDAKYAVEQPRSVFGIRDKRFGISIRLTGLFVRSEIFYFKIQMQNNSGIDYDIEMLNFFIKDKNMAKRTASQEIPVEPLYVLGNQEFVKSHTTSELIFGLPKFTIPDKKLFYVQVREKNGGRHLQLYIGNRKIARAVRL